jgi:hypothetical protein
MTAKEFEGFLEEAIQEAGGQIGDDGDEDFQRICISTFEQVGMLTRDRGLVVRLGDGKRRESEFQVTIVPVHGDARDLDDEEEDES